MILSSHSRVACYGLQASSLCMHMSLAGHAGLSLPVSQLEDPSCQKTIVKVVDALVFAFDSKLSSHARQWFCMLAICLTSCLAPGCELLYVWSLAASTLADLLCMVFDKITVSYAKSFVGPLLPVPVLLVYTNILCLCPDTQIII